MPRQARERGEQGIYHIVVRGANGKKIFRDEGKGQYLDMLLRYRNEFEIELFAYSFFDNHAHLLVREGMIDVSSLMRRLGVSYSFWYKKHFADTGEVFHGRYLSEPLELSELPRVIRYIHREPVTFGLVRSPEEYPYSSAGKMYLIERIEEEAEHGVSLGTDLQENADVLSGTELQAIDAGLDPAEQERDERAFRESLRRALQKESFLEANSRRYCHSDAELREVLDKRMERYLVSKPKDLSRSEKEELIRALRYEDRFSIQLIAKTTGIGRGIVQRTRKG